MIGAIYENFKYRRLKKFASGFETKFIVSLRVNHPSETQLLAYKKATQSIVGELGNSIKNPKQRLSDRSQDRSPWSLTIWSTCGEVGNPFDGFPSDTFESLEKLTCLLPELPEGADGILKVHVFYGDVFGDFFLPPKLIKTLAVLGCSVEFCGEISA